MMKDDIMTPEEVLAYNWGLEYAAQWLQYNAYGEQIPWAHNMAMSIRAAKRVVTQVNWDDAVRDDQVMQLRAEIDRLIAKNRDLEEENGALTKKSQDRDDIARSLRRTLGVFEWEQEQIRGWINRAEFAETENAKCRQALHTVEWITFSKDGDRTYCAWCWNQKDEGHKPDCQRQVALAGAEGNTTPQEFRARWPSLKGINDALDDLSRHWHEMTNADQAQFLAQIDTITRRSNQVWIRWEDQPPKKDEAGWVIFRNELNGRVWIQAGTIVEGEWWGYRPLAWQPKPALPFWAES